MLKATHAAGVLAHYRLGRLVVAQGFEPRTIGLEIRRSILLSYATKTLARLVR